MRGVRAMLDETIVDPPDVIVGDFNIVRGSASLAHLFPGYRHAYDEAGRGYGASFLRSLPLYHIDNMLLGPNVRAQSYRLHYPGFGWHWVQVAEIE